MSPAESDFLLLVLRATLPSQALQRAADAVDNWPALIEQARRHEVIPCLYQAVAVLGDRVPAESRERVRDLFSAGALRALQFAGERRRLTALLVEAGIPVIPWKGPVLAEELYGDAALRTCADLDLLVPPAQAWLAVQRLLADGYLLDFTLPPNRWPALQRAVNHLTFRSPHHAWLVELHWAPFHPMHAFPWDFAGRWQALSAGGAAREGRMMPAEMLVLLSAHGSVHRWEKLKWIVDIDRLVRRHPELEWEEVDRLAGRMGARRCLWLGLALARDVCGLQLPTVMAARLQEDPVVLRLASAIRAGLFSGDPARRDVVGEYRFHWQSRERCGDRLLWAFRQLCAPRQADWQLFPLGSRCYPLFFLERPLRMSWKWLIRPLWTRRSS